MDSTGIKMRSFGEPLSANRLRHSDRHAELLLRRPLMAPSTSSEGMNGDVVPMATTPAMPTQAANGGAHYIYSRRETPSETFPPPPTEYCETLNEHTGVVESSSIIQPCSSREQDDTDIEDEIVNTFRKKSFIVPSKSQVLFYLSTSRHLRIHHTGCELQVTDSADFPLFDIWVESSCCGRPVWVMESYGRRVLVLSELSRRGLVSFLPLISLFRKRARHAVQTVIDWNGDLIGYFIPGDQFLIQDNSRGLIGRCVRMDQENGSCWQCFLEGTDREVARLERGHLRFVPDVSFQLKLLVLAAMARVIGQPRVQTNCFPFLRY
uniref:Phospholipid scramblase n=1 Tax=Haemonchus contortus TaxID=6289 RepID=A0A7I4Y4J1_HAECO